MSVYLLTICVIIIILILTQAEYFIAFKRKSRICTLLFVLCRGICLGKLSR